MALIRKKLCIDLTTDVEQCAICSAELGRGPGNAGLLFLFKYCRCVICGLCGLCEKYPTSFTFLTCKYANHSELGRQRRLQLYNLDCTICLEPAKPKRVALVCGHVYCRACILKWVKPDLRPRGYKVTCPSCRDRRTKLRKLLRFDLAIKPAQRGIEISLSKDILWRPIRGDRATTLFE